MKKKISLAALNAIIKQRNIIDIKLNINSPKKLSKISGTWGIYCEAYCILFMKKILKNF